MRVGQVVFVVVAHVFVVRSVWRVVLDERCDGFVAAVNDLEDIHKSSKANVGAYSYSFATLDMVTKQVREVFGAHDIAITQNVHGETLGQVTITCFAVHKSGGAVQSLPFTMAAKGGPQDVGSSITYGRRYCLAAFIGVGFDTDDDGAGAQKASTQQASEFAANVAEAKRVFALVKAATDDQKQSVKAHAADHDRKVSMAELQDAAWRAEILELVTG